MKRKIVFVFLTVISILGCRDAYKVFPSNYDIKKIDKIENSLFKLRIYALDRKLDNEQDLISFTINCCGECEIQTWRKVEYDYVKNSIEYDLIKESFDVTNSVYLKDLINSIDNMKEVYIAACHETTSLDVLNNIGDYESLFIFDNFNERLFYFDKSHSL